MNTQEAIMQESVLILGTLEAILGELKAARVPNDLLTAEEVAGYLKIKKSTFQQVVQNSPSFPRPIILPSGGKRWKTKEIKAWVDRQR